MQQVAWAADKQDLMIFDEQRDLYFQPDNSGKFRRAPRRTTGYSDELLKNGLLCKVAGPGHFLLRLSTHYRSRCRWTGMVDLIPEIQFIRWYPTHPSSRPSMSECFVQLCSEVRLSALHMERGRLQRPGRY